MHRRRVGARARHPRAFELRERAATMKSSSLRRPIIEVTGESRQALQAFDLWAQTYPRTFRLSAVWPPDS
jgi:hypothetical protein